MRMYAYMFYVVAEIVHMPYSKKAHNEQNKWFCNIRDSSCSVECRRVPYSHSLRCNHGILGRPFSAVFRWLVLLYWLFSYIMRLYY
jgi:hypothetical protein